ncbi:MAG: NTP transferase domain-containing protein [SAR324 cluster bacterium]|nr:NTP transferase domain-containing protein [SAR324 cluster bacterium]
MKGIVLAGGTGSRLFPLTKVTNKHLLPIGKYPMIVHPVHKLTAAGISDILIVTGIEHMGDVVNLLGSGKDYNCRFTYKVQDEAGGIAQALGLAEDFAHKESICVILGDNIFENPITEFVKKFDQQSEGAKLLIKEVPDPHRYGVPELEDGQILSIEEKPQTPKSSYCVTGIYMYDEHIFEVIPSLKPSIRGELEITDVNNYYIQQNKLSYDILEGWWTDAGTFTSYRLANELMATQEFS